MADKPKIIIESPFASTTPAIHQANIAYVRAALRDSLLRGEVPMASHAIYALPGVLDDTNDDERTIGMEAGFAWHSCVNGVAVYTDRGMSRGIEEGIARAEAFGLPVEMRSLPGWAQGRAPEEKGDGMLREIGALVKVSRLPDSSHIFWIALAIYFIAQPLEIVARKFWGTTAAQAIAACFVLIVLYSLWTFWRAMRLKESSESTSDIADTPAPKENP